MTATSSTASYSIGMSGSSEAGGGATNGSACPSTSALVTQIALQLFDWRISLDSLISLQEETTQLRSSVFQMKAMTVSNTNVSDDVVQEFLRNFDESLNDPSEELKELQETLAKNQQMHAELVQSMRSISANFQKQSAEIQHGASCIAKQWLETYDACLGFQEGLKMSLTRRVTLIGLGLSSLI